MLMTNQSKNARVSTILLTDIYTFHGATSLLATVVGKNVASDLTNEPAAYNCTTTYIMHEATLLSATVAVPATKLLPVWS